MPRSAKPSGGATIIDVAARAGVSPMTVSRVINGQKGVKPETRTLVQEVIRELAYAPNPAARSLVTSSELQIGVVYSNPSAAFMSEFLTGIFEEASIRGARLELLKGERGGVPDADAVERLAGLGLSGIILAPPLGENRAILNVLSQAGTPLAAVGAYGVPEATCVRINDRQAAYEMTRHLLGLGHRRIGFISGNPDQAASAQRMAGFHEAMREVEGAQATLAHGDFSYASGLVAGEELLSQAEPPSAIFASNDDMAAAVVSVAHRRQLDVPRELAVAGFDDTTAAVTLWPTLTTVHQPVRRLAAEALAVVVRQARGQARKPLAERSIVLEHALTIRASTGEAAA